MTSSLSSKAQVCLSPAVTCTAVLPAPRSTVGKLLPISSAWSPLSLVSPSPSCPASLMPQHFSEPSLSLAQKCWFPAITCTALRPPRSTSGRKLPISFASSPLKMVSPYPSRPLLPTPQHFTAPVSSRAHVAYIPTATSAAVRPSPRSSSGRELPISSAPSPRLLSSPVPILPPSAWPQHFTPPAALSAQV